MAFTLLPSPPAKATPSTSLSNFRPRDTPKCLTWSIILPLTSNGMACIRLSISRPLSRLGSLGSCLIPKKASSARPRCPYPHLFSIVPWQSNPDNLSTIGFPHPTSPHRIHPATASPLGPVGAPTADATETYLNTHSDIRLEQILRAPPVIPTGVDPSDSHPPRDSDHDTEILSQSATKAFQRLIAAIDNPPSTPLDIDHQLYSALAGLSSSHPWSTLVLDLKGVLPELTVL